MARRKQATRSEAKQLQSALQSRVPAGYAVFVVPVAEAEGIRAAIALGRKDNKRSKMGP